MYSGLSRPVSLWRHRNIPPGLFTGPDLSRLTERDPGQSLMGSPDGAVNHLESIWRDSKVGEIYEGANEVQRWSIARVALGRDVTG